MKPTKSDREWEKEKARQKSTIKLNYGGAPPRKKTGTGIEDPGPQLNLALTRNALLAIIPFQQGGPLAHFFELYHRHPAQALNLILQARPVL